MKWFFRAFTEFPDFTGRARREEFSVFLLFWILFFYLVAAGSAWAWNNRVADIVIKVYFFVTILPLLAVSTRRLHDMGWNGIWLLGIIASGGAGFLALMLVSGQPGENEYGPDPLEEDG